MNIRKTSSQKINSEKTLFFISVLVFVLFIFYADTIKSAVSQSLETCATVIIPSLFPMLVISRIINEIKTPDAILRYIKKPLNKIFGLSENCFQSILTGLTGGYPVGVKNAVVLYRNDNISLDEAQKLALFCVSPGIAFSVTVIGSCMFRSNAIGIRIFIANILADLTLAFLLKNKKNPLYAQKQITFTDKHFSQILSESISESTSAIFSMCAWICFFSVINALLTTCIHNTHIKKALLIFGEVTNAVSFCSENKNILLTAFCSGFSGFCIIFQLIKDLNFLSVRISSFILSRCFCAVLSLLYERIIITIFPVTLSTFSQTTTHIQLSKYSVWGSVSLLFMCAIFILNTATEKQKKFFDNKT